MGNRASTIAAGAALAALATTQGATAAVSGFRLPPSDSATPAGSEAEGPVAEDIPQSQPRPAEPAPAAPGPVTPSSPATSTPVVQPLPAQAAPAQAAPVPVVPPAPPPSPARGDAGTTASQSGAMVGEAPANAEGADAGASGDVAAAPIPSPAVSPPAASPPVTQSDEEATGPISWIAALLALVAAGAGIVWWRRNRGGAAAGVPVVERPRLSPDPAPDPAAAGEPLPQALPEPAVTALAEPVGIALEPRKLALTLMNAALSYRLEIANNGAEPLIGLTVSADMIAAHASLSREQQLAGPAADAAPQHRVERLEPGETQAVSGEFRLPFPSIVPIRQGSAALLLPLARFRVAADGAAPAIRVFVVGQPGAQPDGALVPFRLDQGPRIYPHLAQRAFV